ncbi:hypothetical protein NDU88_005192 [Pleurodeles waltl]|uniref:Uncharacterized protein n=1 Tax=Pleurodeles waltl TaxID=8319 RepID=A0AAV7L2E8_PLEWA|nr:hypothetical protein NDU88_005192 [Pleurodeles waltl]
MRCDIVWSDQMPFGTFNGKEMGSCGKGRDATAESGEAIGHVRIREQKSSSAKRAEKNQQILLLVGASGCCWTRS